MAEYTYDNILINPYKEGIESLIGKEVYCHDNPCLCLKNANKKSTDFLGVLVEIHKYNNVPFCVKQKYGVYKYTCIIEKKEEPKPEYVPFENEKEFLYFYRLNKEKPKISLFLDLYGIWLVKKDTGACCMVTEIWDNGIIFGTNQSIIEWDELLEEYTFFDKMPCGKLTENNND